MSTTLLSHQPLLQGVSPASLAALLESVAHRVVRFGPGDLVVRAGEPCRHVHFLESGRLKAHMNGERGIFTVTMLTAPTLLAPAFIYGQDRRFPVELIADKASTLCLLDREGFMRFMMQESEVLRRFLDLISDCSALLSSKLEQFALYTLTERVEEYLKLHGKIDNQQQVATQLAVARPSLARVLGELCRTGKVIKEGSTYRLL